MLNFFFKSIELHKYILQMFKWFVFNIYIYIYIYIYISLKIWNMVNNDSFDLNSIDCGWTKVLKIG
jgi:hypothetical protein